MMLGLVFVGVKVVEYTGKIDHHLVPGENFHFDPAHMTPDSRRPACGPVEGGGTVHNFAEGARDREAGARFSSSTPSISP
jgi:hypothetical protein